MSQVKKYVFGWFLVFSVGFLFLAGAFYLIANDIRFLGLLLILLPSLIPLYNKFSYRYTFAYHLHKSIFGENSALKHHRDAFKLTTKTSKVLFVIMMVIIIGLGLSIIFDSWDLAAEMQ